MKSSLECGNDELFSIFQFLDPQSILNSCVRVSQRWKQVACCNALWKYFCNSILMNDVFEWNLELERCREKAHPHSSDHHVDEVYQSDNNSDHDGICRNEYYWYDMFRALFRIPIVKSFTIMGKEKSMQYKWSQLQDSFDFHVIPLDPFNLEYAIQDCSEDYQNEDEQAAWFSEYAQRKRVLQYGWKYMYAKIATLLSILSSGSHCTPNPWNDKLILSSFEYDDNDKTWQVKKSTTISVAAFCISQLFPESGTKKLRDLMSISLNDTRDCRMSISPNIEDSSHAKPFCFFEYMDEYFSENTSSEQEGDRIELAENDTCSSTCGDTTVTKTTYCWYDYLDDRYEHFLWLPMLFNAGGCVRTYTYKAIYLEQNLMRVERYYELEY
ncbi:hypothetical protein C9374_012207 [Naegleria lovaniensis]|uniref:F-box domain-containing protein n=1 Tax=Naegleria lovaniensis TaxID=51637 RepID=A0AA88KEL9_NAELO|nr:uncharacterized protein C9374_012207 [Naegleria lovaniensis]KAG2373341.1 hypothetical protein C9374_012207 [Naegleria lovaniensis]